MAATMPLRQSCWLLPNPSTRSFPLVQEIPSDCRACRRYRGLRGLEPASIAPISTEQSPSTSTGAPSRLLWRIFNSFKFRRLVIVAGSALIFFNDPAGRRPILLAHYNNLAAETLKPILNHRS